MLTSGSDDQPAGSAGHNHPVDDPPPDRGLIAKIYPFSTLRNPTRVWAWGMYDLANQSFALLILTLFFPLYFKDVVVADPQRGDALWSLIASVSLGLTVVASPVLGAVGDARACKKKLLIGAGLTCVVLTALLAVPERGGWLLAAALFIPANLAFNLGSNFMASYLPHLATPRNVGRVSAIGWTMGYIGALLLMILAVGSMLALGWRTPAEWRPYFILAAGWYALNMIPTMLVLREPPPKPLPGDAELLAVAAYKRLAGTFHNARRFRQLFRFLIAFLVYSLGVQTMIKFASILAADFGIEQIGLVVFVAQLTVTALVTAALTARYQDRFGAKRTVVVFVIIWLISCLALAAVTIAAPVDPPQWCFWVVGNGIGIGLGGIGTSSRSMVGRFSPGGRTAEFFGLWGLFYTLAGMIGILSFGQVKAWVGGWWAGLDLFGNANTPALVLLAGFFLAGLILTLRVNEHAGVRAAMREDRDADRAAHENEATSA